MVPPSPRARAHVPEPLEARRMFSVGVAAEADTTQPTVTNVYVASTNWSPAFLAYLQANGMGSQQYGFNANDQLPPANMGDVLPWSNLNQVSVQFSENVVVDQADLTLKGQNSGDLAIASFNYNPETFVATWTLAEPLTADRVRLEVNGDGSSAVTDLAGNRLDGNVDNNPNENGDDFRTELAVLPGDASRNGVVNAADLGQVRVRQLTTTSTGGTGNTAYSPFADINGDGRINAVDLSLVRLRQLNRLPPPSNDDGATSLVTSG